MSEDELKRRILREIYSITRKWFLYRFDTYRENALFDTFFSFLPKCLRSFHGMAREYRSRYGEFPNFVSNGIADFGWSITSDIEQCLIENLWIYLDKFQRRKTPVSELRKAIVDLISTFEEEKQTPEKVVEPMPNEITAAMLWDLFREIAYLEGDITLWDMHTRTSPGPTPALMFEDLPELIRRFSHLSRAVDLTTKSISEAFRFEPMRHLRDALHNLHRNNYGVESSPAFYDIPQAEELLELIADIKAHRYHLPESLSGLTKVGDKHLYSKPVILDVDPGALGCDRAVLFISGKPEFSSPKTASIAGEFGFRTLGAFCPRASVHRSQLTSAHNDSEIASLLKHSLHCPKLLMPESEFHTCMAGHGKEFCAASSFLTADQCKISTRCLMTPAMAKQYRARCGTPVYNDTTPTELSTMSMNTPFNAVPLFYEILQPECMNKIHSLLKATCSGMNPVFSDLPQQVQQLADMSEAIVNDPHLRGIDQTRDRLVLVAGILCDINKTRYTGMALSVSSINTLYCTLSGCVISPSTGLNGNGFYFGQPVPHFVPAYAAQTPWHNPINPYIRIPQIIESGQFDVAGILEDIIHNKTVAPYMGATGIPVTQIQAMAMSLMSVIPVSTEVMTLLDTKQYSAAYALLSNNCQKEMLSNPHGEIQRSFMHHWVFIIFALHSVFCKRAIPKSLILELATMADVCGIIKHDAALRLYVLADVNVLHELSAHKDTCRTVADYILGNDNDAFVTAEIGSWKTLSKNNYHSADEVLRDMVASVASGKFIVAPFLRHLIIENINDRLPSQLLEKETLNLFWKAKIFFAFPVGEELKRRVANDDFGGISEYLACQYDEWLRPPLKTVFTSGCITNMADILAFLAIVYYSLREKKPFTRWIKPLASLGSSTGLLSKSDASDLVRRVHFEHNDVSDTLKPVSESSDEKCKMCHAVFNERVEKLERLRLYSFNRVHGVMGSTFKLQNSFPVVEDSTFMLECYYEKFISTHSLIQADAYKQMLESMIASKSMAVAPDAKISNLLHVTYDLLLVSGFAYRVEEDLIDTAVPMQWDFITIASKVSGVTLSFFHNTRYLFSKNIRETLQLAAILLMCRHIGKWAHCEDDELRALILHVANSGLISDSDMCELKEKLELTQKQKPVSENNK